jgi:ureidoglycolate lyase
VTSANALAPAHLICKKSIAETKGPFMLLPRQTLRIEPLTAEAFKLFGDVIEARESAHHYTINDGFAERYHDLAGVDTLADGGKPMVSIFKSSPRKFPLQLMLLERHPLGSQAFMPLSPWPYLVVVAPAAPTPDLNAVRCFEALPGQGVNYARGVWHHPLLALHASCDFLVIDRGEAAGIAENSGNCDVVQIGERDLWIE